MTTAQTLITDAYIESRVTDSIDGPETNQLTVGLRFLNRIIARASAKNILIPYSTSENFSVTTSSASYTMGSGGTASSSRARKITNCYLRDSTGYDHTVEPTTEQNYNAIVDKDFPGKPAIFFYDPAYPVGTVYFWPYPDASYTAYIESQKDLHSTLSLGTTLSLPGEYEEALVLSLGAKLARANGSPNEMSLLSEASAVWRSIAGLNMSKRIPRIRLPFGRSFSTSIGTVTVDTGFDYIFDFILS
jgi:hypothetical protein